MGAGVEVPWGREGVEEVRCGSGGFGCGCGGGGGRGG